MPIAKSERRSSSSSAASGSKGKRAGSMTAKGGGDARAERLVGSFGLEGRVQLGVEADAAVGQVRRADGEKAVVDDHDLRMNVGRPGGLALGRFGHGVVNAEAVPGAGRGGPQELNVAIELPAGEQTMAPRPAGGAVESTKVVVGVDEQPGGRDRPLAPEGRPRAHDATHRPSLARAASAPESPPARRPPAAAGPPCSPRCPFRGCRPVRPTLTGIVR